MAINCNSCIHKFANYHHQLDQKNQYMFQKGIQWPFHGRSGKLLKELL